MVIYLPQPGAVVGAYKLVELIGQGGGGYVYKAMRGGRYFAVKVLNTLALDGWTRREITALANLPHPNVARFIGYDWWPEAERGYPCIIMEFVSGLSLDKWAQLNNPSTRRALIIFLKIVRALGEVFQLGVLHRDIKESNIIIREYDGEPVLIDFGFSAVAGAPTVTGPGQLPPGTPEYRSPEAIRFLMGKTVANSFTYSLSDELWALGVALYWLLTDVLPFGGRNEPGLNHRILVEPPRPPHIINPRVPEAVSRMCLRMLDKEPGARFQTHAEICTAVEALLSASEGNASWDLPLIDPDSPHRATTVGGPNANKPKDENERDIQEWIAQEPRRGRLPRGQPLAPPALDKLPLPVGDLEEGAQALADAPAVDSPRGDQEEAAAAPPPAVLAGPEASPAAPPVQAQAEARTTAKSALHRVSGARRWRVGAGGALPLGPLLLGMLKRPPLALVAALAVVALAVGSVDAWREPAPAREATPIPLAKKVAPLPGTPSRDGETDGAVSVREVAQPSNPAEANRGAAPTRAQSPAPTPTAMIRKSDTTRETDNVPKHQSQRAGRLPPLKKAAAVGAACALLEGGCTGSTAQVRPTPSPVECPAGWREAHKALDIDSGETVVLQGYEGENTERAPLREGPVTVVLDDNMGKLPRGALLYGTLQLGESRFYGTFTRAQIPGGDTYPVCLVIGHDVPAGMPGGPDCLPGLGDCPAHESKPGQVKIFTRFDVFPKGSSYEGGFF